MKSISARNIARHRALHGVKLCQRCLSKTEAPKCCCVDDRDAVNDMGIHLWFNSFQWQMLATEIYNLMQELIGYRPDRDMPELVMEGYYEAALYHLEYTWIWTEPLKSTVWQMIKRKI